MGEKWLGTINLLRDYMCKKDEMQTRCEYIEKANLVLIHADND